MKKCASCGRILSKNEKPLETHHIQPQKNANSHGFIEGIKGYHKNKLDNLVDLCVTCHDAIDTKIIITGYEDTSNGLRLQMKTM